jgi:hypothetical protein
MHDKKHYRAFLLNDFLKLPKNKHMNTIKKLLFFVLVPFQIYAFEGRNITTSKHKHTVKASYFRAKDKGRHANETDSEQQYLDYITAEHNLKFELDTSTCEQNYAATLRVHFETVLYKGGMNACISSFGAILPDKNKINFRDDHFFHRIYKSKSTESIALKKKFLEMHPVPKNASEELKHFDPQAVQYAGSLFKIVPIRQFIPCDQKEYRSRFWITTKPQEDIAETAIFYEIQWVVRADKDAKNSMLEHRLIVPKKLMQGGMRIVPNKPDVFGKVIRPHETIYAPPVDPKSCDHPMVLPSEDVLNSFGIFMVDEVEPPTED